MPNLVNSPWITEADLVAVGCPTTGDIPEGTIDGVLALASDIAFMASARQWPNTGTRTVRPYWGCRHTHPCECVFGSKSYPRISLGRRDVTSVTEVVIEGETIPSTAYRLVNGQYLLRVDGESWPRSQDVDGDPDVADSDAWKVTIEYGRVPPDSAVWAAAYLGSELLKATVPGLGDCRLARDVVSLDRDGVSYQLIDPIQFLAQGFTGVTEFDNWWKFVNPNQIMRNGRITAPAAAASTWRV